MGLDIGLVSIKSFGEALDSTNTIIWNGPIGVFEFEKFAAGTEGILSAGVLSLIPIIRPYQWHSLFQPILPLKILNYIDAPVPRTLSPIHVALSSVDYVSRDIWYINVFSYSAVTR